MDRKRIDEILVELDHLIPVGNSEVLIEQFGGGNEELRIVGTETGYLRFRLEFMRAAFARHTSDGNFPNAIVGVDIDSVLSKESSVSFDCIERIEKLDQRFKNSRANSFFGYVVVLILGLLFVMTVVGFITTLRWVDS